MTFRRFVAPVAVISALAAAGAFFFFSRGSAPREEHLSSGVSTRELGSESRSAPALLLPDVPQPRQGAGKADAQFDVERGRLVGPEGISFAYLPEELTDGGSAAEMAWLLRNGVAPGSLVVQVARQGAIPIEQVSISDGLSVLEVESLRVHGTSQDPTLSSSAIGLLNEGAALGSIGALDALANSFAFGASRDPVVSEAYTLAAWNRGNVNGGIGSGVNALLQLDNVQRAAALRLSGQILDSLNARRVAQGLPPLQVDRRPAAAPIADPGRLPGSP